MRVLLVGNYAADQQQSMLGFAGALLTGLCDRGIDARMIAADAVFGRIGRPHAGMGKWLAYVDKYALFPSVLKQAAAAADIVHICDQGNAMYVPYLKNTLHLVTVNDLLAIRAAQGELPGWTTGRSGRAYQNLILRGLNQARFAACISQTTQRDLLRLSHVPTDRTSVIYDGLFSPYRPLTPEESEPLLAAMLGDHAALPFLLHVGGNQPYKNRGAVLAIYAALRRLVPDKTQGLRLVLAGKPLTPELRQAIIEQQLQDDVTELTSLSNEQLGALYSRAKALVFPSLYEGFGMPIIEAQACGCPVFTSDRAPMTEVGGTAAMYFDPTQPEQAAQIIADNLGAAARMAAAGQKNVLTYATERMVDDYIQLYKRLVTA